MKILEENVNRDLFMGSNNQLGLLTDLPATLQACASAIEAQRGEMQYATNRGIPTHDTLWTGVPNQQRFQFYCLEALRAVPGVIAIKRFDTDIFDNTLEYEAEIVTEFGTGVIGNTLSGL